MAQQIVELTCPGCGDRVTTGQTECKFCHKPIVISTFNSVYSMPMPEVNKYANEYRKALSDNPDNKDLNTSVAMCYLKLKLVVLCQTLKLRCQLPFLKLLDMSVLC